MREWVKVMMAVALMAVTSVAMAKPEGKGHQGKPQMMEHVSESGASNTNSPNAGDQDKGAARVEERKAMRYEGQGAGNEARPQGGKGHDKGGKSHMKGKNR